MELLLVDNTFCRSNWPLNCTAFLVLALNEGIQNWGNLQFNAKEEQACYFILLCGFLSSGYNKCDDVFSFGFIGCRCSLTHAKLNWVSIAGECKCALGQGQALGCSEVWERFTQHIPTQTPTCLVTGKSCSLYKTSLQFSINPTILATHICDRALDIVWSGPRWSSITTRLSWCDKCLH